MAEVYGEINMDVAMQSTSEEILDLLKCDGVKVLSVYMRTSTQNPISVTGKGKLYYFYLKATHLKSTTSKVSLTIDGKEVMTCTNPYTGGNGTEALFLNNMAMPHSMESDGCYHLYGDIGLPHNYGSPTGGSDYFAGGELTKEANASYSRDTYNIGIVCYTPYCVEFENGFSVSASGCRTDSDSQYFVCYSLDE